MYKKAELENILSTMMTDKETKLDAKELAYVVPYVLSVAEKTSLNALKTVRHLAGTSSLKDLSMYVVDAITNHDKPVIDLFSKMTQNVLDSLQEDFNEEYQKALNEIFEMNE